MFPLWAESDRIHGGLGLLPEDVGQVFAITGTKFMLQGAFSV